MNVERLLPVDIAGICDSKELVEVFAENIEKEIRDYLSLQAGAPRISQSYELINTESVKNKVFIDPESFKTKPGDDS